MSILILSRYDAKCTTNTFFTKRKLSCDNSHSTCELSRRNIFSLHYHTHIMMAKPNRARRTVQKTVLISSYRLQISLIMFLPYFHFSTNKQCREQTGSYKNATMKSKVVLRVMCATSTCCKAPYSHDLANQC